MECDNQLRWWRNEFVCQVRIYIQRGKNKDGIPFIRVEVRLDSLPAAAAGEPDPNTLNDSIDDLWTVMLPILEDIDSIIASFAGRWCNSCPSTFVMCVCVCVDLLFKDVELNRSLNLVGA